MDLQKNNINGIKGMKVHYDDQLREQRNHSNKDIQKDRVKLNYWIGCGSFEDVCNKVAARTAEVDLMHPPKVIRKDRVTVISGTVPCPKEVTDAGKEDEFFEKFYEILKAHYGVENVHGMSVHKDEVHTYIDYQGGNAEEKESLVHAHFWLSPYAKWKEKGADREGINGKNFLKKSTYNELNKLVDQMCRKEFGVAYMTGGVAGKKSVEQLKKENDTIREANEKAAQAEAKVDALEEQIQEKQQALEHIKELPGGMVLAKKARIEQMEETERRYKDEKPLIEQAKKDMIAVEEAKKDVKTKEEKLEHEQEELRRRKARFDEEVNYAANKKVSIMKDHALLFIKAKGLWEEFKAWIEKMINKATAGQH